MMINGSWMTPFKKQRPSPSSLPVNGAGDVTVIYEEIAGIEIGVPNSRCDDMRGGCYVRDWLAGLTEIAIAGS